jgi:hypothetical protein
MFESCRAHSSLGNPPRYARYDDFRAFAFRSGAVASEAGYSPASLRWYYDEAPTAASSSIIGVVK